MVAPASILATRAGLSVYLPHLPVRAGLIERLDEMGVIPATNKTFDARFEKTKITSRVVEPTEGAGLKAIPDQPGIPVPAR